MFFENFVFILKKSIKYIVKFSLNIKEQQKIMLNYFYYLIFELASVVVHSLINTTNYSVK